MVQIASYYSGRLQTLRQEQNKIQHALKVLGWFRLFVFVLLVYSIFGFMPKLLLAGLGLSLILSVLFLFLIKYYLRDRSKLQHINALIANAEKELRALDHDFSGFETGEEFSHPNHAYSCDMDLFGKASVFQYLNRTVTCEGKKSLARRLQNETLERAEIMEQQAAIQELTGIQEKLEDFRAIGSFHRDNEQDLELLRLWTSKKAYFTAGRSFTILTGILPPVTFLTIVLAVFIPAVRILPILLCLLNLFIVGLYLRRTNEEHHLIGKRLESLKKYSSLMEILEKHDFQSSVLQRITKILVSDRSSAARSIRRLSKLVSAFDNRINMLAAVFLEGLLLWDIQCMIRLEKWRMNQGSSLDQWMHALTEFDVLVSLATYAFNHPKYVYPAVADVPTIETTDLGHILIPEPERVCNDFQIRQEGEFMIITGANMAGKSTFLRTVATSMIIAMTGAPVCASAFQFCPMPIFSSMRTSDSLDAHESYFYVELKRLKEMLDRLRTGEKLFIILDEILKGTNSYDKQKGSYAAMEQLIRHGGTGIVATHDLELTKIEKKYPEQITNLCFEIEIEQAKISFDYKLKQGITTRMNASLLMQQMGIID